MLDIGVSELVIIGVVALVVVGPKELPTLLRTGGHWAGKARRMAAQFRGQIDQAIREADLESSGHGNERGPAASIHSEQVSARHQLDVPLAATSHTDFEKKAVVA